MEKLGIIVPYRNRYEHLLQFKRLIVKYLDSKSYKNYVIIIVEQDDAHLFNRGILLNIGFKEAKKQRCDYVIFHDVDMIPIDVDYSYSDNPIHLATNFVLEDAEKPRTIFDEYFGGVTLFPIKYFEEIDGYSNKYWGWGYEDDDLRLRCAEKHIPLQTHKIKNFKSFGKSLKLNGVNAYIKVKNTIDFRQSFSIFISFYPDRLYLNHKKPSDEFTVFSIPGYDFGISYTSFNRYNFCFFDSKLDPYYINSNIKPNYKTNMVVTYDSLSKIAKVYQDGEFIGETGGFKRMYPYNTKSNYYLGAGNPEREGIPNFFKGYIDSFAQWDKVLNDSEILDLSKNETHLLNENFDNYNSSKSLNTYYDANHIKYYKLTDLSGKENHGEIVNCEIVQLDIPEYTELKIPHRRKSLFKSLKHDENGFDGQKWKDKHTRYNQLRFVNEVSNHISLINRDGLSTLKYHLYGKTKKDNIIHLTVGI
jgi:hypothetical protein